MGYNPQESLGPREHNKYHGYTVRGTPVLVPWFWTTIPSILRGDNKSCHTGNSTEASQSWRHRGTMAEQPCLSTYPLLHSWILPPAVAEFCLREMARRNEIESELHMLVVFSIGRLGPIFVGGVLGIQSLHPPHTCTKTIHLEHQDVIIWCFLSLAATR